MTAFYNEIDPFAAAWLRELIKAGHIAPGVVDERSIVDIRPSDLDEYTQCHFFAGIGVWSYALRQAGWADDRPVWTGSCPCQPFSAAGKGGGFADERHLWPAFFHLIGECRPDIVIGEQVASKDGLAWLDLVQADLEGADYTSGAVDTCAAGFGAPHIRQRVYWVADSNGDKSWPRRNGRSSQGERPRAESSRRSSIGGLVDSVSTRLEGHARYGNDATGRPVAFGPTPTPSKLSWLANGESFGRQEQCPDIIRSRERSAETRLEQRSWCGGVLPNRRPGPINGLWHDADWLHCRDGKWRPVEPGTFPLAHGAPARVGRLRGYGNAINAEQAKNFIEAVMESANADRN